MADKPLIWIAGEIKTPPFSVEARLETGVLLRRLQQGENIGLPHSRPMPNIGARCHELRIRDENRTWRIFYPIDHDAMSSSRSSPKPPKPRPTVCSRPVGNASNSTNPSHETRQKKTPRSCRL